MENGRRARASGIVCVLVLLSVLLPGSSCAYLSPVLYLDLNLPVKSCPWRRHMPISWEVWYPGTGGEIEGKTVAPGKKSVRVETVRGTHIPVIAYPLGRLKPAGGFVSPRVEGLEGITGKREIALTWGNGTAAELFLELWDQEEKLAGVDALYLSSLMAMEGEGDPWSCKIEGIRSSLLFSSLSKVHISRAELYEVEILLQEEEWIHESPLFGGEVSSAARAGGMYRVAFTGLYPGMHRFLADNGTLELHIEVDKNGEWRHVCDTPQVFSR